MDEIVRLTPGDTRYPKLLREISDPPETLYCRGNINLLQTTCFAVVGTRKITPYGREATSTITRALARHFTIVSGLALGIDAAAHVATLDVHGRTIAVLGSGIDLLTPTTNENLGKQIIANDGLVISEYPPGTPPYSSQFPARNRIISGLSLGVLVIEADEKSGALITAHCALDQNRDVFAVPGSIFSPRSVGPNNLLRNGAKIVLNARDILDEYGMQLELSLSSPWTVSTKNTLEEKILGILRGDGPAILDEIIRKADSDTPTVIAALSMLEINGIVRQTGSGIYRICN